MATALNTIYPPQVETFMPSFCYNQSAEVWFTISSYNEELISKIQFIHVSMVDQRNNQNVFAGKDSNNKTVYPQYYPIRFNQQSMWDAEKQAYKISIPPQILKTLAYYIPNQYYKIQLRFDLTGAQNFNPHKNYDNPISYFYLDTGISRADALQLAIYTNVNQDNFSEWSTGTLIRPIYIPKLNLDLTGYDSNTTTIDRPRSTDVLIGGNLIFEDTDDPPNYYTSDQLSWYQIKLLKENVSPPPFDSGKIFPDSNRSTHMEYRADLSGLSTGSYQLQIIYETIGGYIGTNKTNYYINITGYDLSSSNVLSYDNNPIINEEEGFIFFNIGCSLQTGKIIVRRSSYKTNFTQWDFISAYSLPINNNLLTIKDTTIESVVGYKYHFQYINGNNLYEPIETEIIHCDFYGGLLSDENNRTLKITFNLELSNRTNATNRTKIDTLGGQYPIFTQNAKLKYHTYSITGRISTEDSGELFLPKQNLFGTEYYSYRYDPPKPISEPGIDTHYTEGNCQKIDPSQDWLYEREYRDAVEEWLNNGKPKLFRSMTEGNMIVMLDGISMTPDIVLGRRLYDFSATMYEIGDGKDLDSIISFGLYQVHDDR